MKPVKVLHVITRMNVGGPAAHVLVLIRGLEASGCRTLLAAGSCEEWSGDVEIEIPNRQSVCRVPGLSRSLAPARDLRALWALYRLMRRERPDVVHTHTAKAGVVGRLAAMLAGVPALVHTYHGNSLSGYFSPRANLLFRRIEQALARVTGTLCVVAEQQADELSRRFRIAPRAQFRVVPLGLDLAQCALPLPPAESEFTVGWLGRLVPVKGVPLLVDIAEEASRRGMPVCFLVAGDGPERTLLESAVQRLGPRRLRWLGWQSDVLPHLAKCHMLIQTSHNEGTPLALIQGMAAARPFVSTAAGGVVDMVGGPVLRESAGCRWYANGVLAPPRAGAFADAIEEIRSQPPLLESMAAAARRFASERYAAERLIGDIERVYGELLARKSSLGHAALPVSLTEGAEQ